MNKDTIYRQAAIDALDKWESKYTWGFWCNEHKDEPEKYHITAPSALIAGLPSAQPEIIRCKDCKHFHCDMPYVIQGIPVLGHEVCNAWGDGCKTDQNGYCFMGERSEDVH